MSSPAPGSLHPRLVPKPSKRLHPHYMRYELALARLPGCPDVEMARLITHELVGWTACPQAGGRCDMRLRSSSDSMPCPPLPASCYTYKSSFHSHLPAHPLGPMPAASGTIHPWLRRLYAPYSISTHPHSANPH